MNPVARFVVIILFFVVLKQYARWYGGVDAEESLWRLVGIESVTILVALVLHVLAIFGLGGGTFRVVCRRRGKEPPKPE